MRLRLLGLALGILLGSAVSGFAQTATYRGPNTGAGAQPVISGYDSGTTDSYGNPIIKPVGPSNPLPTSPGATTGAGNLAVAPAVSVGSTATLIVAARTGRAAVTIVNNGTATIYLGQTSGVTTSTGFALAVGAGVTWNYTGAVYGIVATGTQAAGYSETY